MAKRGRPKKDPKVAEAEAEERRALQQSREEVGALDRAEAKDIPEDPESVISQTSTFVDELDKTGDVGDTLRHVGLDELELRIGALARGILEYMLRLDSQEMVRFKVSLKDKADVALRAITALEGSKTITWQEDVRKRPRKITRKALEAERTNKEKKLEQMLLRRKDVQIRQAEEALKELGEKVPRDDAN